MDTKKLESWANKLLDTGKRNNLINFKDTKSMSIELVYPDVETIFAKAESSFSFEVFDPKLVDDEDELLDVMAEKEEIEENSDGEDNKRELYIKRNISNLKKQSQVLAYNQWKNPITVIKSLNKRAQSALEETGVNVLYIAFGFVHWKESEDSKYEYRAPIILAPISFQNSSAISPFYIQMSEDDIVINPTFDYMLKAQYGIELPVYEEGELQTYLDTVGSMVKKLGWYVSNECKIGLFSFLKINMYEDLKNNKDKILNNENIRKLLGEDVPEDNIYEDSQEEISVENELVDLHNVVDADSSQLEAIQMAKRGKSFVLQGPPGTGKSQTITNIIAECLSDGKKVLFVSEKQAALNVVYEKLKKAGLSEFCLELHSHKANKKEVIAELNRTLKAQRTAVSQRANTEIEQKIKAQKDLDQYEEELHKVREGINKSLYQLYEAYSAYRTAPNVEYVINDIQKHGEEDITESSYLLEQYVDYIPSIGEDYKKNAWYGYKNRDTSYQSVAELKKNMNSAKEMTNKLRQITAGAFSACGVDTDSFNKMQIWKPIFSFLGSSEYITPILLNRAQFSADIKQLRGLSMFAEEIVSSKRDIDVLYDEDVYKLDAGMINKKLCRQFTGTLTRAFSGEYKGLINSIRLCRKDGKKISYAEAIRITELLTKYNKSTEEFRMAEDRIRGHVGEGYKGLSTDWSQMKEQIDYLSRLHDSGISFGKIAEMQVETFKKQRPAFMKISAAIASAFKADENAYREIGKSFDKSVIDTENVSFKIVYQKLGRCISEIDKYDNWCSFATLFERLREKNISRFIDICNSAGIHASEIPMAYKKAFYNQWIDYVLFQAGGIMSNFNRIAHDKAVEIFKQKDELQFEISKVQIRSKLSQLRPSLDFVSGGSALQILMREGEKKRKQKSIRKLLEETGELVQTIKPCFLMSPLSVSTFLSSAGIHFDVVVFDEASQIFPQDAIGAIYRGNQLIVVGDSKQMPPTNFFVSSIESDDDEETGDINDFESILDLCSTSMPQIRLKWHYRSKFEQLISFSNKNFYDGELVTFPSSKADTRWVGVDYYYVDGLFEHKSGRNIKEAEFIVNLIYENIKRFPDRSLGVVAFSIKQQDIIERLLFKRRQEDPSNEEFFGRDRVEPFFIKNLETVQGDERDTIIFSTAYGKDSQGRILQNFGPINRAGGERRLNVAVTRAKINVQLVTSMHSTDITVKDLENGGKRLFREYLDYAEHGEIALERAVSVNAFEEFDSEFELEVYDFLKEKGYKCDTQVGVSNFRIDIGLKRSEATDYVLAIECDGASYHSSRNARDRDRLRQSILEGMGWKFYRIWSTDWFKNNAVEKQRLIEAVEAALSKSDNAPKATTQKKSEINFEKVISEQHLRFPEYVMADDIRVIYAKKTPLAAVAEIVRVEAPVSEEWVMKRIAPMFGRSKVTNVVRDSYNRMMFNCYNYGIIRRNGFLYNSSDSYVMRVPAKGGEKRDIKYIALEELAAGMWVIIKENVTVDKDGLFTSIAKELGFQRVGEAIVERLNAALDKLDSLIVVDGNNISLKA